MIFEVKLRSFIIKKVVFAALFLLPFFAFSQTITLSTDSEIVQTDALFGFVLTAEGSFDSIEEPDFSGFTVENRSQSQSRCSATAERNAFVVP